MISSRTFWVAVAVRAITGTCGKDLSQRLQIAVIGAKIMAPFADTVGFVNGDQTDLDLLQELLKLRH